MGIFKLIIRLSSGITGGKERGGEEVKATFSEKLRFISNFFEVRSRGKKRKRRRRSRRIILLPSLFIVALHSIKVPASLGEGGGEKAGAGSIWGSADPKLHDSGRKKEGERGKGMEKKNTSSQRA